MKWLSNAPKHPTVYNVSRSDGQTPGEALREHLLWRINLEEGEPKATEKYSVEELIKMDTVGLYKED